MQAHQLERNIMNDHQIIQPILPATPPVNAFTQYNQHINKLIDDHMSKFFYFFQHIFFSFFIITIKMN